MSNSKNKSVACAALLRSDHCPRGGHSCCCCCHYTSQATVRLRWGNIPTGNLRGENSPQRGPRDSFQMIPCSRKFPLSASPCLPHPYRPGRFLTSVATPVSAAEAENLDVISDTSLSRVPHVQSVDRSRHVYTGSRAQVHNSWGPVQRGKGLPCPKVIKNVKMATAEPESSMGLF